MTNQYSDRQIGETQVPVTDDWVLDCKPNTLLLTADKTTITANGIDTATITIQLRTPILTDSTYNNIAEAVTVQLMIDDEIATVELDTNGSGSVGVASDEVGVFSVSGENYGSNIIEITAE